MSLQQIENRSTGRAGWFTIGALTASLAFIFLMVAGDIFKAVGTQAQAGAEAPTLIIEGK